MEEVTADDIEVRLKTLKSYLWSPTLVADDYERREAVQETAEERLTSTIVKLGEVVSLRPF